MTESPVFINVEQQTPAWYELKRGRIGASAAPIILGDSPYKTRWELWCEILRLPIPRTSKRAPNSFAMDRGNRFEQKIRSIHELQTGFEFIPEVVLHPKYDFLMASLDGFDRSANIIAEYKTCGADVLKEAREGIVTNKYKAQVQMQLMLSQAKECHFFCAQIGKKGNVEYIEDTALVIVKPDLEYQKKLLFELISFWGFVEKRISPPLTEKDFLMLDDSEQTVLLFSRLKKAQQHLEALLTKEEAIVAKLADYRDQVKAAEEELEVIKEDAISYAEEVLRHPKIHAIGVLMVKYKRGGWKFYIDQKDISREVSEG